MNKPKTIGVKSLKSYRKNVSMPRLVIGYDGDEITPRHNDNAGYFFTKEGVHKSPDGNTHELYRIMIETSDEAKDSGEHIELMKTAAKVAGIDLVYIFPIYRYEHGSVIYKRGTAHGFDYSNCGFYFITAEALKRSRLKSMEAIKKAVDAELKEYTQWVNGEVYQFMLYDEKGVEEDSSGGFYDIEDIREYLTEEWASENLQDYFKNY